MGGKGFKRELIMGWGTEDELLGRGSWKYGQLPISVDEDWGS